MPGMLRTIVIIEGGRSLGAGFVYGDSYGEEKTIQRSSVGKLSRKQYIFQEKWLPTPCCWSLEVCDNHLRRSGDLESMPAFEFHSIPFSPAGER
jgi:hypothetical protein